MKPTDDISERWQDMREEILNFIEKNSRVDLKEVAVCLGITEIDVANELAAMESEGKDIRHAAGYLLPGIPAGTGKRKQDAAYRILLRKRVCDPLQRRRQKADAESVSVDAFRDFNRNGR